jgi:ATP-dependent Clp protease ATP-binding subunit ClpA
MAAEMEIAGTRAPYSARLRTSILLAREEAHRYNHNYVGTEHLLLGLLRVEDGVAAKLLSLFGVNLNRARGAMEYMIGRGDRSITPVDPGFAPRVVRAMALANEERHSLGHADLGTEHLLLGILRVEDAIATRILTSFEVTFEGVSRALNRFMVDGADAPAPPRSQVITCRVSDRDLDAIDALVEAGIRAGRSDAAAWLISAGIDRNPELFQRVYATSTEILRLRGETQAAVERLVAPPSEPAQPE